MANVMKDVAKLLGVKLNEKFNIKGIETEYKITLQGLYYYNPLVQNWFYSSKTLDKLLLGYDEIIKLPKPILDEKEKEYLSNVIKPFRNKAIYIIKRDGVMGEYIAIHLERYTGKNRCADIAVLPEFEKGTMYKCMQSNKEYTLEELGL